MTTNPNSAGHGTPAKSLHRSDDRIIAGVCSGIAQYAGIDVTLVRILAAILTLFGGGGIVLYLVAWLVMPDAQGHVIAGRRQPTTAQPHTSPPPTSEPPTSEPPTSPSTTTTEE